MTFHELPCSLQQQDSRWKSDKFIGAKTFETAKIFQILTHLFLANFKQNTITHRGLLMGDSSNSAALEQLPKECPTRRGPESRDWGVPGQSKSQEELVHQHTTELGGQPGFEPTVWTSSSDPARAGNFDITTETTYSQFGASNWNRFSQENQYYHKVFERLGTWSGLLSNMT